MVGLAGSYTRMLLKAESYNRVRQERETLRKNYNQMVQIAHDRDVQVASLGALASEVSTLYGLRQNKMLASHRSPNPAVDATPTSLIASDVFSPQDVKVSLDQFYALREQAMSGRITRIMQGSATSNNADDWALLADAPSLWPLEGRVASSFGERQDPINGEGEFHAGIDIDAPYGTPIRAGGDGDVALASMGFSGYGHEIVLDHGHGLTTIYGHMSALAVLAGQHVTRGQVIGYVGQTGHATGPHLHYEVRVHNVPVNPHKFLRTTYEEAFMSGAINIASK